MAYWTCHAEMIATVHIQLVFNFQVANIKKTLKSSQQQDVDEQMVTDSRDINTQPEKPAKKSSKTKG